MRNDPDTWTFSSLFFPPSRISVLLTLDIECMYWYLFPQQSSHPRQIVTLAIDIKGKLSTLHVHSEFRKLFHTYLILFLYSIFIISSRASTFHLLKRDDTGSQIPLLVKDGTRIQTWAFLKLFIYFFHHLSNESEVKLYWSNLCSNISKQPWPFSALILLMSM